MGLVSPTQIQADPCQSAFYTLRRFLKSKFQQEAGKPSQEEGRAGSDQGLPGTWQRSTVRTTEGACPAGKNTEKAGGVDGVSGSKVRGASAPVKTQKWKNSGATEVVRPSEGMVRK